VAVRTLEGALSDPDHPHGFPPPRVKGQKLKLLHGDAALERTGFRGDQAFQRPDRILVDDCDVRIHEHQFCGVGTGKSSSRQEQDGQGG
jgi:hypothetical protein